MRLQDENPLMVIEQAENHDEMDCGCVLARDEEFPDKVGFVPCERHREAFEGIPEPELVDDYNAVGEEDIEE